MLKSPAGHIIPDDFVPGRHGWCILQECLTLAQFDQIKRHINALVYHAGGEFVASQWLPPNETWQGTPLQLINDIAARRNDVSVSRMFAIMVWITLRDHDELFCFRGERGGVILLERQIYSRQEA